MDKVKKFRSDFKTAFKKKRKTFFNNPERFLKYPSEYYSPEYLRQLKYRIKKRYGSQLTAIEIQKTKGL